MNFFNSHLSIYSRGKGVVTNPETQEKYYIKQNSLKGALNGDIVQIKVFYNKWKYPKAIIGKIIKRSKRLYAAIIYSKGKRKFASIYPYQAKQIILKRVSNKSKDGDLVQIEVLEWRENHKSAYGKVVSIISNCNDKLLDFNYIYFKHSLNKFKSYTINKNEISSFQSILDKESINRIDLRNLYTITIDPRDAKDFDDAISIISKDNTIDLYIHIADVTSYVKYDSEIDRIARDRANSYYLTERTIHMLPEQLSTYFCSLVPGKDRLAFTVKVTFDNELNITSSEIFESLIKSNKRLSYDQADEIMNCSDESDPYFVILNDLKHLTHSLKKSRLKSGGFEINNNEIAFNINENGVPINTVKKNLMESHSIVEECMLLANKIAAMRMIKANKKYKIGIFRNHEAPNERNKSSLEDIFSFFLKEKISGTNSRMSEKINHFLNLFQSTDVYKVLSLLVMKKMQKARYSTLPDNHFGLGFSNYTHFTSPIRRYADLLVHQIIKGNIKDSNLLYELIELCNEGELKSQLCEREYQTLKGLRFLNSKLSNTYTGFILEFKGAKIFVHNPLSSLTGYILKRSLPKDKYILSKNRLVLKGISRGIKYKVGQKLKVKIEKVDFTSHEVCFYIPPKD